MRKILGSTKGQILIFIALAFVVLGLLVGLAVDGGRAYLLQASFSKMVDAATLAGGRKLFQGINEARAAACDSARVNGFTSDGGAGTCPEGLTVLEVTEASPTCPFPPCLDVTFSQPMNTSFMLLGTLIGCGAVCERINVSATARGAPPSPLDVVLVLDQSFSLALAGVCDDLQTAANSFVDQFDESKDRLGLVSFQVRAGNRFVLGPTPFKTNIKNEINSINCVGYTNMGEGLSLALEQLNVAARPGSVRIVVFFTDGRPTAFRDILGGQDRVMAVDSANTVTVRGFWDNPDSLPLNADPGAPNGCSGVPVCFGRTNPQVRITASDKGRDRASDIRAAGTFIFTIGLGDPNAGPLLVPDHCYLMELANDPTAGDFGNTCSTPPPVNPAQPQGNFFFAPSGTELQAVFDAVADMILRLRLTV